MAEAIAVIGLVASVASLIDLGIKVSTRLKEFADKRNDVPKSLLSLSSRLPLLTETLKAIQEQAQAGQVPDGHVHSLQKEISSVLAQLQFVQQCLDRSIVTPGTSRIARLVNTVKSVASDKKLQQALSEIHRSIDVLGLFQAASNGRILQHLVDRDADTPPSPASFTFGICLGQAPQIDSDAFIGRETEVQTLRQWLLPDKGVQMQKVVSITGMGGIGKTQLSLAYARLYGHYYSSVFWLDAKDETSLRQSMSSLYTTIHPENRDDTIIQGKRPQPVEEARQWLSQAENDQWLIIFDNYDDPDLPNIRSQTGFDIRSFFPSRAQGNILITTRTSKLTFCKSLQLRKLDDVELGLAVLSQRSGRYLTEDDGARKLATRLDGLPLALATAGAFLGQTNISCTDYQSLYDTKWTDLHGPESEALLEYGDRTLFSTWAVSLDQVRRQSPDAAELLQLWGYFASQDIWFELIQAGGAKSPPGIRRITEDRLSFHQAMAKLRDYSLIDVVAGVYCVHPCLHDWILEYLNTPPNRMAFSNALRCIDNSTVGVEDPQYRRKCRRLQKHATSIQNQHFASLWKSPAINVVPERNSGHIYWHFAILYQGCADFVESEKWYLRAIKRNGEALGSHHESTLKVLLDLGALYQEYGQMERSKDICLNVLTDCEALLGSRHRMTVQALVATASIYLTQHKLDEAEAMYTRALEASNFAFGLDPVVTLDVLNALAIIYEERDQLAAAESMYTQAFEGLKRSVGDGHHMTLTALRNRGTLAIRQGKLNEAETMLERCLDRTEMVFKFDYSLTFETVRNLVFVYFSRHKLEKAAVVIERTLPGTEAAVGPKHHATMHLANALAYVMANKIAMTSSNNNVHVTGNEIARMVRHVEKYLDAHYCIHWLGVALDYIGDEENFGIAFSQMTPGVQAPYLRWRANHDYGDCDCIPGMTEENLVCCRCHCRPLCHECTTRCGGGDGSDGGEQYPLKRTGHPIENLQLWSLTVSNSQLTLNVTEVDEWFSRLKEKYPLAS